MPTSPLESAGAAIQPTSAAPLHTNEFFTGFWSNASPLGPGAVPYVQSKYYGASRYDRLVDGSDVEISPRLTLIRRPGHSVYNSQLFPPINRFYEFRGFSPTDEVIRIVADCDGSTNQLQNPNFDNGATGWTLGTGWSIGVAGHPTGPVGNTGVFTGPGSGAITNQQHIPCVPGTKVSASCWALGEPFVSGAAVLNLRFYDSSNTLLATVTSPGVVNNYQWQQLRIQGTAPTSATYATVDFTVTADTATGPRWFVWGFQGGYTPLRGTVREVTQPSTNTILWTKNDGAGKTSFVSDGNVLYAGDGNATHQWVTSAKKWLPNAQYAKGDFIIDSNNNVQMAMGAQTATITKIQVDKTAVSIPAPPFTNYWYSITIYFDPSTPLDIRPGVSLTLSGLTTVPWMNGTSQFTPLSSIQASSLLITNSGANPAVPLSLETGTATTGAGISGGTEPVWNATLGQVTQDASLQWVNMGSAVMPWGSAGPTTAPTVSAVQATSNYPAWAPNTWYAPYAFIIVDGGGNLEQVITAGTTKNSPGEPAWAAVGGTTNDGTVVWKNLGPGAWQASHAYAVGDTIKATYTYNTTSYQWTTDGHGGFIQVPITIQVTATSLFQCITAGTSGSVQPAWNNGIGVITQDGPNLVWKNLGAGMTYPGSSQTIVLTPKVIDPAGYIETPTNQGKSGATAPTFSTVTGGSTIDNGVTWFNSGPSSPGGTNPWQWAYSGKNSITGEISNPSPVSIPFAPAINQTPVIQGQGLPHPPWDKIVLWRTAAGGSTLLYDDEFLNPGPGNTWIYTDTNADPGDVTTGAQGILNQLIKAPINNANDPPPSNFIPEAYYLGRIFGYTNNILRWTGGPDVVVGNGNDTMAGVNQFRLPSKGVLCWPTSIGLICFTTTDIWALLGQGTDQSPFYMVNFQAGIGMASSDAFGVNGSTAYAMLTSHQVVSMDPGAGELEVGFPIADFFDNYLDPAKVYITWHQGRSADTALYVADGSSYFVRMAAVSAPESGNVWSLPAVIRAPGQVRAMASVEITPGEKVLILGPNVDGQPILKRDSSVHSDNTVPYLAHATIAPVVLSQPGSTAGVQFVVTEEKMIAGATALTVKMLFDEMHDFINVHDADWRTLRNRSNDPPNLPKQKSFNTQRLWAQQDPSTVIKCRFYEQDISWPAEDFANELYTNTIYGRLPEKARK